MSTTDNNIRHFLTLTDLSSDEFRQIIHRAIELKAIHHRGDVFEPLKNKVLAMIFEKSSTRTRVSFESGMAQFGGHAIFLSPRDTQLGRGEPVEDSARVLSSMADCLMVRTFEHQKAELLAENSSVPVINGLTDDVHPCQLLADMQTYFEKRGDIKGKTVTWVGDGNNMCHSYMHAAKLLDFKLNIACPQCFEPQQSFIDETADHIEITQDVARACTGSDLIVTDVWASMGQEEEQKQRERQQATIAEAARAVDDTDFVITRETIMLQAIVTQDQVTVVVLDQRPCRLRSTRCNRPSASAKAASSVKKGAISGPTATRAACGSPSRMGAGRSRQPSVASSTASTCGRIWSQWIMRPIPATTSAGSTWIPSSTTRTCSTTCSSSWARSPSPWAATTRSRSASSGRAS